MTDLMLILTLIVTKEVAMDLKDYCSNMGTELTAWKARMYDVLRKLDKLGTKEKEKILPNVEDLHILVADMESRIHALATECPTEWKPQQKKIDTAHIDMRSKFEETMKAIGKAAPVSVPG